MPGPKTECNVGIWKYENGKLRKCENEEMRELQPRRTCTLSHFLNIPIFSLPYSHILTLHYSSTSDHTFLTLRLAKPISFLLISFPFVFVLWRQECRHPELLSPSVGANQDISRNVLKERGVLGACPQTSQTFRLLFVLRLWYHSLRLRVLLFTGSKSGAGGLDFQQRKNG